MGGLSHWRRRSGSHSYCGADLHIREAVWVAILRVLVAFESDRGFWVTLVNSKIIEHAQSGFEPRGQKVSR
jgi:hypothetical protein